jgi:hypothetical protein
MIITTSSSFSVLADNDIGGDGGDADMRAELGPWGAAVGIPRKTSIEHIEVRIVAVGDVRARKPVEVIDDVRDVGIRWRCEDDARCCFFSAASRSGLRVLCSSSGIVSPRLVNDGLCPCRVRA